MSLLPESITRTWSTGNYYFPEGNPFPDALEAIWGWITDVPMPSGGVVVPDAISEIPDTWEEYEQQYPEYFEPILETRPGRTPDPYPQDVSDDIEPEDEVAHTWGHLARDLIGGWLQPEPTGALPMNLAPGLTMGPVTATGAAGGGGGANGCDGMTWAGGAPPKGYKVVRDSCGNGVLRKVRRRRRRRMLTAGDKTDIASIVSMVGKGQLAASLINRSAS